MRRRTRRLPPSDWILQLLTAPVSLSYGVALGLTYGIPFSESFVLAALWNAAWVRAGFVAQRDARRRQVHGRGLRFLLWQTSFALTYGGAELLAAWGLGWLPALWTSTALLGWFATWEIRDFWRYWSACR